MPCCRCIAKIVALITLAGGCWLLGAAPLEAGEVVKCTSGYHNVNYYEIRKITRCIVRMDKAKFGEYLAIKTPDRLTTLAEGKIIKKKGNLAIILLTKCTPKLDAKLPVDFSPAIPAEDAEISHYTKITENHSARLR